MQYARDGLKNDQETACGRITMSKAIEDLEQEHEAILSSLQILDRITADIGKDSTPDQVDLISFLGFLKEFADKCHHGKEEAMLFPALAKAGIPEKRGLMGQMLSEHEQGRNLIKEMEHALASGPDYKAFAGAARRYSTLLQAHIKKENGVLFPLAEKTLDNARLEGLFQSFEEHEEKVIGHGRHEELHRMLEELTAKYAERP
jgi:hemerythrin-like domain-containing protein